MDGSYSQRAREWMDECLAWEAGVHPEATEYKGKYPFFWEWEGGPPRPEDYRPDWPDETATAYQFYENVSEGTPLSPVVATLEALVDWLATAGGYSRAAAEAFAKDGYAPSMIYSPEIGLMDGVSALEFLKRPGYSPKE